MCAPLAYRHALWLSGRAVCETPHAHCARAGAGTGRLNGRAEQLLGQFIAESPAGAAAARGRVAVATKLAPYPWRVTAGQFVGAARGSLRRLGLEQVCARACACACACVRASTRAGCVSVCV